MEKEKNSKKEKKLGSGLSAQECAVKCAAMTSRRTKCDYFASGTGAKVGEECGSHASSFFGGRSRGQPVFGQLGSITTTVITRYSLVFCEPAHTCYWEYDKACESGYEANKFNIYQMCGLRTL